MERMLDERITRQVREVFASLKEPVKVIFFGSQTNCQYCDETRQLLEEVCGLSDLLELEAHDVQKDAELAKLYRVEDAPTTIIAAQNGDTIKDYGVRLLGIPSGHEFSTLIHTLITVSQRDSGLQPETREFLAGLKQPVKLQVFITPT